jgi:hypothetical protein
MSTLEVSLSRDELLIGERFSVSFQRTLRIPQDDQVYPLPPGLGRFPLHRVEAYPDRVPNTWRENGGVFLPMYQREALWLGFGGTPWKPNAVKIAVGGINAISGETWDEALHEAPQDYVVCPDQPWLDGINAGAGFIRQFVAMPLGLGQTVEAQVSGVEEVGGIQILVYEPKLGIFPDAPPPMRAPEGPAFSAPAMAPTEEMGLGAGGKIKQKVYPDPYGIDTWDPENYGHAFVYIVNSEQYRGITGLEPPPTPVGIQTYVEHGLPWFDLYDETLVDIPAPKKLENLEKVKEREIGAKEVLPRETKCPSMCPNLASRNCAGGPKLGGTEQCPTTTWRSV